MTTQYPISTLFDLITLITKDIDDSAWISEFEFMVAILMYYGDEVKISLRPTASELAQLPTLVNDIIKENHFATLNNDQDMIDSIVELTKDQNKFINRFNDLEQMFHSNFKFKDA